MFIYFFYYFFQFHKLITTANHYIKKWLKSKLLFVFFLNNGVILGNYDFMILNFWY